MSPAAVQEISNNITLLARDEASIEDSFNQVYQSLNSPMLKAPPFGTESVCKSLELLSQKWVECRERFHEQVKRSKETAGEIRTVLDDLAICLLGGILLNTDVSFDEKKETLVNYVEKLTAKAKKSQEGSEEFCGLSSSVASFQQDWKDFMEMQGLSTHKQRIKELDASIATSTAKIQKYHRQISILKTILHVFSYACLLTSPTPRKHGFNQRKACCDHMNKIAHKEAMQREGRCAQAEELGRLNSLKTCLQECADTLEKGIQTITARLDNLSSFWKAVHADVSQLRNFLQSASEWDGQNLPKLYELRLGEAKAYYQKLSAIFKDYQCA